MNFKTETPFMKLYEKLNSLNEAKADVQRLVDFAGDDLANRFLAIKNKLKYPENDLYYWIKNKTASELERAIAKAEHTKSNRQLTKSVSEAGAELVCDTNHWRVYHITTFEASQKYGRDTKWCITGIDNSGDWHWRCYVYRGVQFYFLISKANYNARGANSKFAIALYPKSSRDGFIRCEIFDQQDNKLKSFSEIPFFDEIDIQNIDFDSIKIGAEKLNCTSCTAEIELVDSMLGIDNNYYCEDCYYDLFFTCDKCGKDFSIDCVNFTDNDDTLCDSCFSMC